MRDGEQKFTANCSACHGAGGVGTKQGPPLVHKVYSPITMAMPPSCARRPTASNRTIGSSATCRRSTPCNRMTSSRS
uniref:c-type cytochrome n=1 Tax=Nitrospira cf. moscoviensis SBR1015 TaxID=96242 RepID=UPI000B3BCD49|nr:cytochrome c [Nitrospira cf. moscoviensis SBR1015]